MRLFSILKKNSKLALRGNWGRAIIILLILMGASTLISVLTQIAMEIFAEPAAHAASAPDASDIAGQLAYAFRMSASEWVFTGITVVLSTLLIAPLALGQMRWYYNLVHSKSMPVTELFYFFESGKLYARAIGFEINLAIRTLLWMVLFYAPPSAVLGVAIFFLSGNEELPRTATITATSGIFIAVVLYIIATIFYAACICRYILTPYLIAEDSDLTVRQAIKLSVKYTRGHRFGMLWFGVSYIGWFLLGILLLPLLYVAPYYYTGIAMYSRFIIEKNRNYPPHPGATQEFAAETGGHADGKLPQNSGVNVEIQPGDVAESGKTANTDDADADYTKSED